MNMGAWAALIIAAVGLMAFVPIAVGFRRWRQGGLAASQTGSRIALTARGPIEYALAGRGPPLLVIHGGMGGYDQALGLGDLVNRHAGDSGFMVVAPSRPGYLRTAVHVGLTPEEQADALAALLDHFGIAQVGVLAGSYGGPIAVQFALRHPHRMCALVLLAAITERCVVGPQWPVSERALLSRSGALLVDFVHWLLYLRARSRPTDLVRFFMSRMTAPSVDADEIDRRIALLSQFPDQVRALQQMFCSMTPMSLQMAGSLNDEKQIACLPAYPLEDIRAPTLWIQGRDDCVGPGFAGAESATHRIPGARLLAVEQCGHFMLAGDFLAPVFSAIAEFLHQHASAPAGFTGRSQTTESLFTH
jgi:pimeloyl-ACP methyl ester carboxylesterase